MSIWKICWLKTFLPMSPNCNSGSTARLVLSHTPKKPTRHISDITSWMEAFSIFYLILCSYFPHWWRDLTSYKLLILWTYRQFSSFCWLNYDRLSGSHSRGKAHWLVRDELSSYSTTIQLALKFVLAQLQPIQSPSRQRLLVALLVKLFAILGMQVTASLSILTVDSAMHVAGVVVIIELLLVLLCNQLFLTLWILRNQSATNAINCCAFV